MGGATALFNMSFLATGGWNPCAQTKVTHRIAPKAVVVNGM
jgi:hypothetical protein